MGKDMNETRQNRGNSLWLPSNIGFSTEAGRGIQWLLQELSSVISFIPQLNSQKPFLRSTQCDLPGFHHLEWINDFMSRIFLLPSFLALLLNPVTSALFPPLSFSWFDPTWQRRRRKRTRRPENNTIETLLRYDSSLPLGQVRDLIMPPYPEEESDEVKKEIITSFYSSHFIKQLLPSLTMNKVPLSSHQRESVIINNNLVPTVLDSGNVSDTIEMLHLLANDRSTPVSSQTPDVEGICTNILHEGMNSSVRFTQPTLFSSKVAIPLPINFVTGNRTVENELPFRPIQQLEELSQSVGDREVPEYQKVFTSSSPSFFTHSVHQMKSLPLIHSLAARLQRWFSKNKTRPIAFNTPPEQIITNSIIVDLLSDKNKGDFYVYAPHISVADSTLSPELPDISNTSINAESKYDTEIASPPSSTHLLPFAFDFQQGIFPTAGDLPLAIRNSFSLMPHFLENSDFKREMPQSQKSASPKTAEVLMQAISSPGNDSGKGYHRTEGMELALAPVGRPENVIGTRETASASEQSTERRSQAEEAQAPAPDYEALATEVYDILKRKLFIEKERSQGIK